MPCYDGRDPYEDYIAARKKLDEVVAMLCDVISKMNTDERIKLVRKDIGNWYEEHKRIDRARERREFKNNTVRAQELVRQSAKLLAEAKDLRKKK